MVELGVIPVAHGCWKKGQAPYKIYISYSTHPFPNGNSSIMWIDAIGLNRNHQKADDSMEEREEEERWAPPARG